MLAPSTSQTPACVGQPAFYVDGELYRTVGTPTELSEPARPPTHGTSSTSSTAFRQTSQKPRLATPNNGGRWQVHLLSFPEGYEEALADGGLDGDGVLDSAEEVGAALAAGSAVDEGVAKQFECPAIPLRKN